MTMADIPLNEISVHTRINPPAHFLIEIESFSLLSKHKLQRYESREFTAGDHKWRLILYPDGHQSEDYISVYLSIAESSSLSVNWEVNAMFNILLYNNKLDNFRCSQGRSVCRFHRAKSIWGFSQMIPKKSFTHPPNGYLVDDNCIFGAEVLVLKSQHAFERLSVLPVKDDIKRLFVISNFSQLKEIWYSKEFSAGGFSWKIKLYPDGQAGVKGKSISIYIMCVNLGFSKKVKAHYRIRIKDQFDDAGSLSIYGSNWFDKATYASWGRQAFASITDIRDPKKGYVVDGCCVVEAEIYLQAITYMDDVLPLA